HEEVRMRPCARRFMALAALASVASGCVSTALVHSTNVYQTGSTAGKGHWRGGVDATAAPEIRTDADSAAIQTTVGADEQRSSLGIWAEYGVTQTMDLGFDFEACAPGGYGLR